MLLSLLFRHVVDDIVCFEICFQCAQRSGNSCTSWCKACSCWIGVINLDGTFCCLDVIFGDKMCGDDYNCEMVFHGVLYVD